LCRKAVECFPIGLLRIVDYPSARRTWASKVGYFTTKLPPLKALYVNLAVYPEVFVDYVQEIQTSSKSKGMRGTGECEKQRRGRECSGRSYPVKA
jgi:hypothetical protein